MKKLLPFFSAIVLLFSLNVVFISDAQARFSGGHSSSSHSSSSHSSSSHSSSSHSSSWSSHSSSSNHYSSGQSSSYSSNLTEGEVLLILLAVIVTFFVLFAIVKRMVSIAPSEMVTSKNQEHRFNENQLINFKKHDANFSRILFLDFVHLLYVKYYSYYGKKEFSCLIPYLDNAVQHDKQLDLLIGNQVIVISEIVINSVRLHSIDTGVDNEDRVAVEIESNFTVHPAFHTQDSGKQHTRYMTTERWFFQREKGVLSLPPEKMQALTCPACGAPAHFTDSGECGSCGTAIVKGQQQWYLKKRLVLNQTVLNVGDLVAYAEEEGTTLPSMRSSTMGAEIAAFEKQHTVVWSDYWETFNPQIVQSYFMELNAAWTNRQLNKVRHLISDRLYEANKFWMDLYQQQNWHTCLDDLRIQDIQLIKIEIDAYYEVITVRIFASCFDYTVDDKQKVIGGSKKKLRAYTEYWTFARRAGVEDAKDQFDLTVCPQCAAPADKMGQSAICGYCGSKISTGEFSWILFLITQDENYLG